MVELDAASLTYSAMVHTRKLPHSVLIIFRVLLFMAARAYTCMLVFFWNCLIFWGYCCWCERALFATLEPSFIFVIGVNEGIGEEVVLEDYALNFAAER